VKLIAVKQGKGKEDTVFSRSSTQVPVSIK
jgi:hypothetical protein